MGMCLIDKELLWGTGEYMKCFSFTGNRFYVSGNFPGSKNKGKCCRNFSKISRISCLSKEISWNKNNSNPG